MSNPLHPIVGPEDYISPYDDINYSKGPKIIYGDVDVFTVVLNDAQSDADDEWGRTEQIALRMIIDEAIAVHKELFGWAGILGIKDKFDVLAGMFVGLGPNFDHPELSVLTIGNTSLADGTLTVGTGSFFNATSLSLNNGVFTTTVDPITSYALLKATEAISGKSASLLLYPTSSGSTVILNLSGTTTPDNYRFVNSGSSHYFEMPYDARVGGILTASTINATMISCYSFSTTGDLTGANLTLTGTDALATMLLSHAASNQTLIQCTDNSGGTIATLDIYTDTFSVYQYYKTGDVYAPHPVLWYGTNGDSDQWLTLHLDNCLIFNFGGDIVTADNGVKILAGADSGNPNTPWNGIKLKGLVEGDPNPESVYLSILTGSLPISGYPVYGLVFSSMTSRRAILLDQLDFYAVDGDYNSKISGIVLTITNTISGANFYADAISVSLYDGTNTIFSADSNGIIAGDSNTKFKVACVVIPGQTWAYDHEFIFNVIDDYNANAPLPNQCYSVIVSVYDPNVDTIYHENSLRFKAWYVDVMGVSTLHLYVPVTPADISEGTVDIRVTFVYNADSLVVV
jgi:hypothetical protein